MTFMSWGAAEMSSRILGLMLFKLTGQWPAEYRYFSSPGNQ